MNASQAYTASGYGILNLNSATGIWERTAATLLLPPNSRYIEFQFLFNNTDLPSGEWAYGDAASLVLSKPYTYYCNRDGGDQLGCIDCPCGNNAAPTTVGGCLNSAGQSARLFASGSAQVSLPLNDTADLRIALYGAPSATFAILLSGDATAPVSPSHPCFGVSVGIQTTQFDGLRCRAGNMLRHGIRMADVNGNIGLTNRPWGGEGPPPQGIAQEAGFLAGQTVCFQIIYRDDPNQSCGTGLNTTQAVEVTFF